MKSRKKNLEKNKEEEEKWVGERKEEKKQIYKRKQKLRFHVVTPRKITTVEVVGKRLKALT